MEQLIELFKSYGTLGLFIISFVESFISPILPDMLLIPMALANTEQAIYYSLIATLASILGGFVGYGIGNYLGVPVMQRIVPQHYIDSIHDWLERYGGWAIFLAALAPIPYKFVSISAGVFRVNMFVFILASVFGRAKRFLLEGVLIYYFGPMAVEMIKKYSHNFLVACIAMTAAGAGYFIIKRFNTRKRVED